MTFVSVGIKVSYGKIVLVEYFTPFVFGDFMLFVRFFSQNLHKVILFRGISNNFFFAT